MSAHIETLVIHTTGKATYEITSKVQDVVKRSNIKKGVATVFIQHTSASLIIYENADPTARVDLENYFDKLVPENLPYFTHTYEGSDDMPSHIRMVLTRTSETIPIENGRLCLGTWQGIFVFEHRRREHERSVVVCVH
ncbi:secondary thiamine-phosphate synthase enzyme YjbQ [Candidatus Uabimicrobium sp. HlEnr_7]|uniref:secondary thiamine-phosphate synthase enzyme YjbQ n=1 Tax=Candidatus Uabimicrobium helgolandensis TaxID=3095367 RepID=UPI0035567CB5